MVPAVLPYALVLIIIYAFHRSASMSDRGKLCTRLCHALRITPFVVYCILCYVLPPSKYSRSFSSKDFIKEILLFELCCVCSYAVLIHSAFMLNTNQLCPQSRSCIYSYVLQASPVLLSMQSNVVSHLGFG